MKKILFITSMYPDPLRTHNTKVCHFYTLEWKKMGYEIIVINLRSMFPPYYVWAAKLFPKLAQNYIGNHVELDTKKATIEHSVDDVLVYSMPIFKFRPHRRYPLFSLKIVLSKIQQILKRNNFSPDIIIGHFLNPAFELVSLFKQQYPKTKSVIVFHEDSPLYIKKYYSANYHKLFCSYDLIGFRNRGMKDRYERIFGTFYNSFICYSGTKENFLTIPQLQKNFEDDKVPRFVYVGQLTRNKCVLETIKALHIVYNDDFCFTCVGGGGEQKSEIIEYLEKNNIEDCVTFVGPISRDDIISYYDNNEVFIMISKSEAFGLVYLEAMARGCITIGTRNQGIDGVIEDGINGFLCEGGETHELEKILYRYNQLNSSQKVTISQQAIITANKYSDKNVAQMYIHEIEKLFI